MEIKQSNKKACHDTARRLPLFPDGDKIRGQAEICQTKRERGI